MKQQEFYDALIARLYTMFPKDTQIYVQDILKNNGVSLDALIVREPDVNISPTIYLEDYYSLFEKGTSLNEICHILFGVCMEARLNHSVDPGFFTDFDRAKERMVFHLVNYQKNIPRLRDMPHIRYLDLAITFCCMLRLASGEAATIQIKNEHLAQWGVGIGEIKKHAFDNTPRLLPAYIQPIADAIRDLMEENESLQWMLPIAEPDDAPQLYVLTNETQFCGASCILYPSVLSEFSESLGTDLYVLPSSIHEVLLLPAKARTEDEPLNELVRTVNSEQLTPSQQLSDKVYYYSRARRALLA